MEHLVSIIIPTCEREKELKRAIDSVKNQTYKNIEIVVIDNSDIPKDENFFNGDYSKVRYLYNDISKDLSRARNQGIGLSTGDFVAFLNDGDVWESTKVEKQVKLMLENPSVPLTVTYSHDLRFGQDRIDKPPKRITHKMLLKSFVLSSVSSYMIRRYPLDMLKKSSDCYFDISLESAQEYELAMRMTQCHDALCVPEVLVTRIDDEDWSGMRSGIKQVYKKHRNEYSAIIPIKLFTIATLFYVANIFGNKIYGIILSRINCK